MSIDRARRAYRDSYRGDLVRDGIELPQYFQERRNPIDESDWIGAADGGRRALDGPSNNAHFRYGFPCGFSGCIHGRDVWSIESVGWSFLLFMNAQVRYWTKLRT